MIRTQITFDEDLYRRPKKLSRRKGVALSELCRRAVAELIAREASDKPWMADAGLIQGGPSDSERFVVVYGREAP